MPVIFHAFSFIVFSFSLYQRLILCALYHTHAMVLEGKRSSIWY